MSTVTNLIEDILEIKSSTGYLLLPFLILLISNLKFTIGLFADKHIKLLRKSNTFEDSEFNKDITDEEKERINNMLNRINEVINEERKLD